MCGSGSAGNLDWMILLKSQWRVTGKLLIWCRAAVTLDRRCVLSTVHEGGTFWEKEAGSEYSSHQTAPQNHSGELHQSFISAFNPCSCWASPAHRDKKSNRTDTDINVVARNVQNATAPGVIQYGYSSEDTAGKLRANLECFCWCEKTQTLLDFLFF